MKGKIYTTYFAKLRKTGDKNNFKFSIAAFNPKWLSKNDIDGWLRNLAPGKELLNDYKYKGISWDEYTKKYLREINNSKASQLSIKQIINMINNGKNIYLICYEKSTDNCHRHLLAEILKEKGYEVEEF